MQTTKIINTSDVSHYDAQRSEAAHALRDGALVVFPTETVYGVAANAANPDATRRLRDLKGQAAGRPFTVHLGRREEAAEYVPDAPPVARRLARKIWPGPLTLICSVDDPAATPVARRLPAEQLAEVFLDGRVGLRLPDHPAATRLLREAEVPIVASSANRSGRRPPTNLEAALEELGGAVDFALDGGPTRLNTASTIVEIDGNTWTIQRNGALDERTIHRLAKSHVLFVCTGNSCRSPLAEYLFRHRLAESLGIPAHELEQAGYAVASAGTFPPPNGPISAGSREELAHRGIDASGHRAQPVTIELIRRSERIFVMSPEHRDAVIDQVPSAAPQVELLDVSGPITDPIGGSAEDYRRCAEHIERAIAARVEEFTHEDRNW